MLARSAPALGGLVAVHLVLLAMLAGWHHHPQHDAAGGEAAFERSFPIAHVCSGAGDEPCRGPGRSGPRGPSTDESPDRGPSPVPLDTGCGLCLALGTTLSVPDFAGAPVMTAPRFHEPCLRSARALPCLAAALPMSPRGPPLG